MIFIFYISHILTLEKVTMLMKQIMVKFTWLVFITSIGFGAHAQEGGEEKSERQESLLSAERLIKSKLHQARPDITVNEIKPSAVNGMYEAEIDGGGVIYVSADGNYFFLGDLYQVMSNRLVNLSEAKKNNERVAMMSSIQDDDAIVFPAKGDVKATIAVFTDVDCGYCRKLHQEVPKMNELGISVKYLAYPRAGIGSKSYEKIASAWCSDDKQNALTALKRGQRIDINVCENNPVPQQFNLGSQVGVRGTPAIVLENGELIPGYLPADELAKTIGI